MKKYGLMIACVAALCLVATSCVFQSKEERFISLLNRLTLIAEDVDADEAQITAKLERIVKDYEDFEDYDIKDFRFTKKQKKEIEQLKMRLALAMLVNVKFQAVMLKMSLEKELGSLNSVLNSR